MLLTTHYMDEADKLCDRIAIVDHGELKALDSPMKLKTSIPGKNVLEVSFSQIPSGWAEQLAQLPEVEGVTSEDRIFRISSHNGPRTTLALMEAAARRNIDIQSLAVQSTTLDDVFVHYTGRGLRDALQEASPQDTRDDEALTMKRTLAIIEREMRRFRRSPVLIAMSMVMPIVQLVVLGNAFGGNVKHLKLAIVDQDHGVPAVRIRELTSAVASGARTIDTELYTDQGAAITDLRNGRMNGVLIIPPDFSRRVLAKDAPRVALIEDNTDNFVSVALAGTLGGVVSAYNQPVTVSRVSSRSDARHRGSVSLRPVHSVPAAGFGRDVDLHDGDDRRRHHLHRRQSARAARGLPGNAHHEVRAHRRLQHLGHDQSGHCGIVSAAIGSFIAGIPNPLDPMRLLRLFTVVVFTSFALISLMFLIMVRVSDPLLPRAIFGVLNTLLYFPSGAVYPQQGFPGWMQVLAVADPFTYAVHAFKSLLLKNTGFNAIASDLGFLLIFSVIAMTAATRLFKRSL